MQRPGMDPDNASPADFICDFCLRSWSNDRPMVEGHKGSLICAACLTISFDVLWNRLAGAPAERVCALCLENRDEMCWTPTPWPPPSEGIVQGLAIDAANPPIACKRCVKQSVVMLERDSDYGWKRPS